MTLEIAWERATFSPNLSKESTVVTRIGPSLGTRYLLVPGNWPACETIRSAAVALEAHPMVVSRTGRVNGNVDEALERLGNLFMDLDLIRKRSRRQRNWRLE